MLRYRLKLESDDNGTILVTSPDLPIVTYGETEREAFRHADEAILAILSSLIDAREDVPVPMFEDAGNIGVPYSIMPLQIELKVHLYLVLRAANLTRADLQRSLGWQRESVDRLFRLDHKSRLEQIEAAFKALDKVVTIGVRAAPAMDRAAA